MIHQAMKSAKRKKKVGEENQEQWAGCTIFHDVNRESFSNQVVSGQRPE